MNDPGHHDPAGDDARFAAWLATQLRASEHTLDAASCQQLAAARARAVAAAGDRQAAPRRWRAGRWLWLPPAALAAVLALALVDITQLSAPPALPAVGEWLADGESPEFYQSLEFIEWLDEWADEA